MRKPNENALEELAALLDTWQPEAQETDLWPQIAARLAQATQSWNEVKAFAATLPKTQTFGKDNEVQSDVSDERDAEPIIRMVDTIFQQAQQMGASLIYFFPKEKGMQVWFRISGHIHEVLPIPKLVQNTVVARLKILAGLNIAEYIITQEGTYSLKQGNEWYSFGITTKATRWGEKVTVRLPELSPQVAEIMESAPVDPGREREFATAEAFSERFQVVDITAYRPHPNAVSLIPASVARRHRLIPVRSDGQTLYVAMADPQNAAGMDDVKLASGKKIVRALWAYPPDIDAAIDAYYKDRKLSPEKVPTEREAWIANAGGRGLFTVDLTRHQPEPSAIAAVPAFVARRHRLVPVRRDGQTLYIGIADTNNLVAIDDVRIVTKIPIVRALVAYPPDIEAAIEEHYGPEIAAEPQASPRLDATGGLLENSERALGWRVETIRLPESAVAHLEQIRQAREAFTATHGRPPTPIELAEAAHLPQERVELLLEADSPEPTHLGDVRPESWIFRQALRDEIDKALEHLSEREKEVLSLRYGLSEDQEQLMTLEQVGKHLHLTREQARQIEAEALQKLRRSELGGRLHDTEPTEQSDQSKVLTELSGTLSEVVGELTALRREVTRLREEVAALRRERSGGGYPTLMPYARADDRPLPLG